MNACKLSVWRKAVRKLAGTTNVTYEFWRVGLSVKGKNKQKLISFYRLKCYRGCNIFWFRNCARNVQEQAPQACSLSRLHFRVSRIFRYLQALVLLRSWNDWSTICSVVSHGNFLRIVRYHKSVGGIHSQVDWRTNGWKSFGCSFLMRFLLVRDFVPGLEKFSLCHSPQSNHSQKTSRQTGTRTQNLVAKAEHQSEELQNGAKKTNKQENCRYTW